MIVEISDAVIVPLISAVSIGLKELGTYLIHKRVNGKAKEEKAELKRTIEGIKFQTDQIPLIKKDLERYNERCENHLRHQDKINTRCEEEIEDLDKKIFEHVRDNH